MGSTGDGPISRTMLAFFIVSSRNSEHVVAADEASVNLDVYWRHVVRTWLRESLFERPYGFDWMLNLTQLYMRRHSDAATVYQKRHRMIVGKTNHQYGFYV